MKADDEHQEAERRPAFYEFSSFNRKDGKTHPVVIRRRNRALAMWAEMATIREIAEALDIDECTVRSYIRRARRKNDARVERGWENKFRMRAVLRRNNIRRMHDGGMDVKEIASRLGVNVRLVQRRLKEGR